MKFRNRGKHNFGHLRKVNRVYEYVETRISRGDIFTVQDMAKDLKIARTTCIGILQELQETTNGELQYSRGSIVVKNVGTNGYGKVSSNNEGVKVKKVARSTQSRLEKKERVYAYLCELAKENKPIPCLSDMHKDFTDMHVSNLMDILKVLDEEDKIIYKRGQVLAVNYRDVKSNTGKTLKYVKQGQLEIPVQEEQKEIKEEVVSDISLDIQTQNYDKAVKELIADYILNADITTREEIMAYIDALLKITNKLKEKLF